MDRHEYGVTKNRKAASTGGGRAWSEEEEVYLLQTRLQKMPYKHIAAHLKKTELACRLHFHQLSHGSNRRKRTTSVSSGSSTGHSPIMPTTVPSPIRESPMSRSSTPPGSSGSYGPSSPNGGVQLPSIMGSHVSPRLPAILPKPAAMTLPPLTTSPTRGYPTPVPEPHSAALPSATFPPLGHPTTPPLRLDCSILPPPAGHHTHVDMGRLQAVYNAHRGSFWAAVAADYGSGMNPMVLEQAWKSGICCTQHQTTTPITPVASPDNMDREYSVRPQDKTRISAILGIDTSPRSPQEHLRRPMEDDRRTSIPAAG